MGNICGKSESDAFDSPGRVLGSAPAPGPTTAPVPKKVGGPPRTLGGASSAAAESSSQDRSDARAKAAEAAQARAKAKSGGKLQAQLTERQRENLRTTVAKDADLAAQQRAADDAKDALDYN